jgi:L-iditol 2-dehydrogenase
MGNMRQAVLVAPHEFRIQEAAIPQPGPGDVVIQVEAAGICGSDLHTYHGENPVITLPRVMGHEMAGRVVAAGPGVEWQIGQAVAVEPDVPCGQCEYCRAGLTHYCTDMRFVGSLRYDGAFADYVLAPAKTAFALPANLSPEEGTFAEPVAVAVHALRKIADVPATSVLVLGAGTIGQLIAQTARAYGARCVVITDVLDGKLRTARALGVECTINPEREDLEQRVREQFGPTGPDVTYDCVGFPATVNQGLRLTRKGGTVFLVGVPTHDLPIAPMEILLAERSLTGIYIYLRQDYVEGLRLLTNGQVRVGPLISATFGLSDIGRAFEHVVERKNEAIKVIIRPTDN